MSIAKQGRWLVPVLVMSVIIIIDQATKAWVVQTLGPTTLTKSIPVLGEQVRIVYLHNTGVAFSLFQGFPEVLTVTALLIVAGAIYFYITQLPNHRFFIQLILGFILGGAFGNIIDRVRLGYVIDFISVGTFPVFNVADSAINIGAALLMLQFVLEEISHRRERRAMAPQ